MSESGVSVRDNTLKEPALAQARNKKQKTVLVHEDALSLLSANERINSVPFQRQFFAAILKYFFSDPGDSRRKWVRLAYAIDKGECTVAQAAIEALRADKAEMKMAVRQGMGAEDYKAWARYELARRERNYASLVRLFEDAENPTVDEIIARWNEDAEMYDRHRKVANITGAKIVESYDGDLIGHDGDHAADDTDPEGTADTNDDAKN